MEGCLFCAGGGVEGFGYGVGEGVSCFFDFLDGGFGGEGLQRRGGGWEREVGWGKGALGVKMMAESEGGRVEVVIWSLNCESLMCGFYRSLVYLEGDCSMSKFQGKDGTAQTALSIVQRECCCLHQIT